MTVVYGDSGVGKTFIVVDLSAHIASGRSWRGKPTRKGMVIYIAAELPVSVKRRLWAWKQHHGVHELPVLIVTSTIDLLGGDTGEVAKLIRATLGLCRRSGHPGKRG
jgi:RecA-family ATPase